MLTGTWSVMLTVLFAATGAYSLWRWAGAVSSQPARPPAESVIDLNQTVMSAAMLIMVWSPVGPVGAWLQIAAFAIFAVIMLLSERNGDQGAARRQNGSIAHLVMNLAMIWMLAAMPLLMPRASMSGGGHHHHVPAGPLVTAAVEAPLWVAAVSWLAVGLTASIAVWWSVRAIRSGVERAHCCCHAVMGVGMAAMIGAMA